MVRLLLRPVMLVVFPAIGVLVASVLVLARHIGVVISGGRGRVRAADGHRWHLAHRAPAGFPVQPGMVAIPAAPADGWGAPGAVRAVRPKYACGQPHLAGSRRVRAGHNSDVMRPEPVSELWPRCGHLRDRSVHG